MELINADNRNLKNLNYKLSEDEMIELMKINTAIDAANSSLYNMDVSMFNESELKIYFESTYKLITDSLVRQIIFYRNLLHKLNLNNIDTRSLLVIDEELYSRVN